MSNWWETKPLTEMSTPEWESLCDGCGKCCRIQLEDAEGQRATTNVVCRYMDMQACCCTVYEERTKRVPTCLKLSPDNLEAISWMPDSCSYRLIRDGQPLPEWHPLVGGDKEAVHHAGASVRDKVISEEFVAEDDLEEFIIQWH